MGRRPPMHTAAQIWFEHFAVEVDGVGVASETLLNWDSNDRFGIVVREPFGALGAGLLISCAVAAFYDAPGRSRRTLNIYPEIYLFHVGQRWGDHSPFDFWPERKELDVEDTPSVLLAAINSHAITHLAVPDGAHRNGEHYHREPEAAQDRLKQCFVYRSDGSVPNAGLVIRSADAGVISNYASTLKPELWFPDAKHVMDDQQRQGLTTPDARDMKRVVDHTIDRWTEIERSDPAYVRALARIEKVESDGVIAEAYRQVDVQTAIGLL